MKTTSRAQLVYERIATGNEPLPDAFGYKYKDTSIRTVIDILESTVNNTNSNISPASMIINECKDSISESLINEGFINAVKSSVPSGVLNIVRGSLINGFNVDIDKDPFHRIINKDEVNTRSPEFKDNSKVYVALVKKDEKSCLVILYNGKIVSVSGSEIISKDKDTCNSVIKKSTTVWWSKSNRKNESKLTLSKAQKLLIK